MIRPYLIDMINDHKVPMKLRIKLPDKVIDYETQFDELKIQLTMQISLISSKDSEETFTWHAKSDSIKIMTGSEKDGIINELIDSPLQRHQKEEAPLFLIALICYTIIFIKQACKEVDHM